MDSRIKIWKFQKNHTIFAAVSILVLMDSRIKITISGLSGYSISQFQSLF